MKKLRVAAYCRVSTDQDDQRNSLQSQQRYFDDYMRSQENWESVGVFADEGITGTSTRKRRAFHRMIALAERGEIDLILTKEVSRFARNTVDTLEITRRLKERGVGVLFLVDNIDTRDNDGEFRLSIMASVAQEESRKTSERVRWGQRRQMERGVVFGNNSIYGFDLKGGRLTVREDEAEVVRRIFHKFAVEGKGTHVIARELSEEGIAPPRTATGIWSSTMVLRILRNEKFAGDLLQKKHITKNYLTHKKTLNDGSEEPVYIRAHHEAVVERALFEHAQAELARRAPSVEQRTRYSNRYWCSGRIQCGGCGSRFILRVSRREKLRGIPGVGVPRAGARRPPQARCAGAAGRMRYADCQRSDAAGVYAVSHARAGYRHGPHCAAPCGRDPVARRRTGRRGGDRDAAGQARADPRKAGDRDGRFSVRCSDARRA